MVSSRCLLLSLSRTFICSSQLPQISPPGTPASSRLRWLFVCCWVVMQRIRQWVVRKYSPARIEQVRKGGKRQYTNLPNHKPSALYCKPEGASSKSFV